MVVGILDILGERHPDFKIKLRKWTEGLVDDTLTGSSHFDSLQSFLDGVYGVAIGLTVSPTSPTSRMGGGGTGTAVQEPNVEAMALSNYGASAGLALSHHGTSAGSGSARGSTPRAWDQGSYDSAVRDRERSRGTKRDTLQINEQLLGVMDMGGEEESSEDKIQRLLRVVAHLRGRHTIRTRT